MTLLDSLTLDDTDFVFEPAEVMAECERLIGLPILPDGRPRRKRDAAAVRAFTYYALKNLTDGHSMMSLAERVGYTHEDQVRPTWLFQGGFASRRGADAFVKWVRWNLTYPAHRLTGAKIKGMALEIRRRRGLVRRTG